MSSYCKVNSGDIIGGYEITGKLGRGRFSSVWAATHDGRPVALKIYREGNEHIRYYSNEVKILTQLATRGDGSHIINYLGTMAHVACSCNGPMIHPCVVFDVYGDSLNDLIKYCKKQDCGIPAQVVKKITRELLTGLSYLHKNNIIHTDIKPSNILMNHKVDNVTEDNIIVYLADLGSSTFSHDLFSYHIGTTQYIAPEIIVEDSYSTSADIWSLYATCYELLTGDLLFDVFGECDTIYGIDVDEEALEDIGVDSMSTASESSSSDSSQSTDNEKINYRHLLLIVKLLGYPPESFCKSAREYFDRRNKLIRHPEIESITIYDLLRQNYELAHEECQSIHTFLAQGLRYRPEERIKAIDALSCEWLA